MPTTLFFAPFDLPDVGTVEVSEGGEFLLGQATLLAEFADSEANILNDVTLWIDDLRLMIDDWRGGPEALRFPIYDL